MGSDCDDAAALAVLHKLADRGEANILGVIYSSGTNPYGVGVCDAINTYYGRGDLPLGQYKNNDVGDPIDRFCKRIATDTKTFKNDVIDSAPEMLETYKQLLRAQPDNSVTLLTVGHPHPLYYLAADPEALNLVRYKVQRCVTMGGAPDTPQFEWNLCHETVTTYTANILRTWPTPHYISWAGEAIITGNRKLSSTPEDNPVREAFQLYDGALTKGRSSWDIIAVLFAVRPEMFKVEPGTLVQEKDFKVRWVDGPATSTRYRVIPKMTNAELESVCEELMAAPPGRFKL